MVVKSPSLIEERIMDNNNNTTTTNLLLKSSLAEYADKKLLAILRDGRKLLGYLRTYDQFSNLVFQSTVERIYAGNLYADIPRGIFMIRGENLLFLGEYSSRGEVAQQSDDIQLVLQMQRNDYERRDRLDKLRQRVFCEHGYGREMENELF